MAILGRVRGGVPFGEGRAATVWKETPPSGGTKVVNLEGIIKRGQHMEAGHGILAYYLVLFVEDIFELDAQAETL